MRSISMVFTLIVITSVTGIVGGTAWAQSTPLTGPWTTTASIPGNQFTPAVAWDHKHGQWFVV
jgi:hypothetical protein